MRYTVGIVLIGDGANGSHSIYRRGITEAWGRGTLKMAELTKQAGLVLPEFESHAGEVIVRFRPIRYAAPLRIGHNLSELQRQLLEALSVLQAASLADLRTHVYMGAADRTLQENLLFLRQLGLIHSEGRGRGARWIMNQNE